MRVIFLVGKAAGA